MGEISPFDIIFALLQVIVAVIFFLRVTSLPDFFIYILGGGLLISALYTLVV